MIGWVIAAIVLTALLVGCYFIYKLAFYNDLIEEDVYHIPNTPQYQAHADKMRAAIKTMENMPYEPVSIIARDGTFLAGRYYHVRDDAPVQIQMHGYRGNVLRDFCGGHALGMKMGHNVLAVDQRAHGQSGSRVITFGIKERFDCLDWVNYVQNRFGKHIPVVIAGVSMGGATVLMASELFCQGQVAGIIADCPYSAPKDIICKVCDDMKFPGKLMFPLVIVAAGIYGHFNLLQASAIQAVKHTKAPILLIHGEDDRFVPCYMSRKLQQANPNMISLEIFPEAGHGLSYMVDKERYEKVVKNFFEGCLDI